METIGSYMFYGCKNLTFIDLPEITTTVGSVFTGCIGITSIDLKNVTTLDNYVFENCSIYQQL